MKRVLVIGCPGSGKSCFSVALHRKSGLPLYHLDRMYWDAEGKKVEKSLFDRRLREVLEKDEWILDGDYASTMEMRMAVCDTVFFLDFPTSVCLEGVISRLGKSREDMPWVQTEMDEAFLDSVKSYREKKRPQVMALLERFCDKRIYIWNDR